jgi:hypothetical protein
VQCLYFTYAMARRRGSPTPGPQLLVEVKQLAAFLPWPVIGFVGALGGSWLELEWLAPLGVGGLFCHYWLDGRIWTRPGCGCLTLSLARQP